MPLLLFTARCVVPGHKSEPEKVAGKRLIVITQTKKSFFIFLYQWNHNRQTSIFRRKCFFSFFFLFSLGYPPSLWCLSLTKYSWTEWSLPTEAYPVHSIDWKRNCSRLQAMQSAVRWWSGSHVLMSTDTWPVSWFWDASFAKVMSHVNSAHSCPQQQESKSILFTLRACHHYRKRGSASHIVREVRSVRERDTERERERETEVTSP